MKSVLRAILVVSIWLNHATATNEALNASEHEAWNQLQDTLLNASADVTPFLGKVFNDLPPSQILDGLKALEAASAGDIENTLKGTGKWMITRFSGGAAAYLAVYEAAAITGKAIIANWVADIYDHPAYKGAVEEMNRVLREQVAKKDPWLPSIYCANDAALKSKMEAMENAMYYAWVDKERYQTTQLMLNKWASRLRLNSGKGLPTTREVFNSFLQQAISDQAGFIRTTYARVGLKAAAKRAKLEIARKALVELNPRPYHLSIKAVQNNGNTAARQTGDPIHFHFSYKVGPYAQHKAQVSLEDINGNVIKKLPHQSPMLANGIRTENSVIHGVNEAGNYKLVLYVEDRFGRSEAIESPTFEVERKQKNVQLPSFKVMDDTYGRIRDYLNDKRQTYKQYGEVIVRARRLNEVYQPLNQAHDSDKETMDYQEYEQKWISSGSYSRLEADFREIQRLREQIGELMVQLWGSNDVGNNPLWKEHETQFRERMMALESFLKEMHLMTKEKNLLKIHQLFQSSKIPKEFGYKEELVWVPEQVAREAKWPIKD
jgi:hypothetical protein